jgi:hypothetical protein
MNFFSLQMQGLLSVDAYTHIENAMQGEDIAKGKAKGVLLDELAALQPLLQRSITAQKKPYDSGLEARETLGNMAKAIKAIEGGDLKSASRYVNQAYFFCGAHHCKFVSATERALHNSTKAYPESLPGRQLPRHDEEGIG